MPTFSRGRWGALLLGVAVMGVIATMVFALVVVVRDRVDEQNASLSISVLSSRPDAVSGATARIQVSAPAGVPLSAVRVMLNETDVTSQLKLTDIGLAGVVSGLTAGKNTVRAVAPGTQSAYALLTNHRLAGPLLSGSQQQPFVCELSRFALPTRRGLAPAPDGECTVAPRSSYLYRSERQQKFLPLVGAALTDPARRPADLAEVTTATGARQPFIVRVETLTIDRGVAQIAMLDDPADATDGDWNRKLVYGFGGGGCGSGYRQGSRTYDVMSPRLLAQGFAIASNSLNVTENNCNDVVAAEAFAMTREYFVKAHGVPTYTMGIGCSGGAAQAYQIADNYPGLLDGIVAGCSLADLGFDLGQLAFDSRLLAGYERRYPAALSDVQLRQVTGFGSWRQLDTMSRLASVHDPRNGNAALPAALRYDPRTNPDGVRTSIWDQTQTVYGFTADGRVRRPIGNTGVQYGLQALNAGMISAGQFLDLNERIGGLDQDLNPTADRTEADNRGIRTAYSTGRVLNGGGGLATIPIIDYRAYSYGAGQASLDLRYHTFVIKQRLIEANGDADNQVRLTDSGRGRFNVDRGVLAEAIDQMDAWITAVKVSPFGGHQAVVASKPTGLVDACWTPDGRKIAEEQSYAGSSRCNQLYPMTRSPRMVAGGPLTSDVLACVLSPADRADYPASMTDAEFTRLQKAFPKGVCDWTAGSDGQRDLSGTWLTY